MSIKKFLILVELSLLCFLTGCNNVSGLDEHLIVYGLGVDKIENVYELTAQALNAQNTESSTSNDAPKKVNTVSASGTTLLEAEKQLEIQTGKKILYSHAIVLIIGEETAKDGINEIVRFFSTNHKLRPTVEVLISNTPPKDVLSSENKFNAEDILSITRLGKEKDDAIHSTLRYLLGDLEKNLKSAKVWYLENEGDTVACSRIAFFQDDKLLTVLGKEPSKGALLLLGKVKNISDYVEVDGKRLLLDIKRAKPKVILTLNGEQLNFKIDLKVDLNLYNPGEVVSSSQAVEEIISVRLMSLINDAITDSVKNQGCDIFNFHKYIMNNYVDFFKTNENKIKDLLMGANYKVQFSTNIQHMDF